MGQLPEACQGKTDKGKHYSKEQVFLTRKLVTKQLYDTEVPRLLEHEKRYWNCFMRDWEFTLWHIEYWHCWFVMGSCKIQNMWMHQLNRKAKDKTLTSQRRKKGQPWPNEITVQHCIIETIVQVLPSAHGLSKQINLLCQGKTLPLWSIACCIPENKTSVVIIILQNCLLSQEPLRLEFHIPDFKQCF